MMGLLTYIKLSGNYSTETLNELKEAKEKELCLIGESFLNDLVSYYNFTDIRDAIDKIVKGDIVSKNITAVFAKVSGKLSSETSLPQQQQPSSQPPNTIQQQPQQITEENTEKNKKKKNEYDDEDDDEINDDINTASDVANEAKKKLREAKKEAIIEEKAKKRAAKIKVEKAKEVKNILSLEEAKQNYTEAKQNYENKKSVLDKATKKSEDKKELFNSADVLFNFDNKKKKKFAEGRLEAQIEKFKADEELEEAEKEFEEAKEDLENAKEDLENAKEDLENKINLKQAIERLEKAKERLSELRVQKKSKKNDKILVDAEEDKNEAEKIVARLAIKEILTIATKTDSFLEDEEKGVREVTKAINDIIEVASKSNESQEEEIVIGAINDIINVASTLKEEEVRKAINDIIEVASKSNESQEEEIVKDAINKITEVSSKFNELQEEEIVGIVREAINKITNVASTSNGLQEEEIVKEAIKKITEVSSTSNGLQEEEIVKEAIKKITEVATISLEKVKETAEKAEAKADKEAEAEAEEAEKEKNEIDSLLRNYTDSLDGLQNLKNSIQEKINNANDYDKNKYEEILQCVTEYNDHRDLVMALLTKYKKICEGNILKFDNLFTKTDISSIDNAFMITSYAVFLDKLKKIKKSLEGKDLTKLERGLSNSLERLFDMYGINDPNPILDDEEKSEYLINMLNQ